MTQHWSRRLVRLGACSGAVDFAKGYKTFAAAWSACPRSDWLLWYLQKALNDADTNESLRCIAIRCTLAITNRQVIPAWDKWGLAYLANENRSDMAAWSAAESATGSATGSAAESAARSATGLAAGLAAESAAWSAAESAARSAVSAAGSAARLAAWSTQANIVREYFPKPPIKVGRYQRNE